MRSAAFIFLSFLLLLGTTVPARAEVKSARALEIQAAFLVKFSSYVKWPEDSFSNPDSPVTIGIFGRDPFGTRIDDIARSYTIKGRKVDIRRCNENVALCQNHIVYVPPSEMGRIDELVSAMAGRPVLLVGNAPDFLDHSGMINFVMVGNKIRFDISRENCRKAGLEISSKLLKVAHALR